MPRITKPNKRSWAKETAPQTGRKFVNPWYHTVAWRKMRKAGLRGEPYCATCMKVGIVALATVRDHIKNVSSGKTLEEKERLMWDLNNHQSQCAKCHNSKSGKERHWKEK